MKNSQHTNAAQTVILPAEHADPETVWFVPEALRAHYCNVVPTLDAGEFLDRARWAIADAHTHRTHGAHEPKDHGYPTQEREEHARIERNRVRDEERKTKAESLSLADIAPVAQHLVQLRAAQSAHEAAEIAAQHERTRQSYYVCPVCGVDDTARRHEQVKVRGLAPNWGVCDTFTSCGACSLVAQKLITDDLATDDRVRKVRDALVSAGRL